MKGADEARKIRLRAAEALLPAFAWVLGGQAWRLAVGSLAHATLTPWLVVGVAAVFLPVLAAPSLTRHHTAPRAAAGAALVLGGLRLTAALVGPALAGAYGWLGLAAFALYLALWPAACPSRRQAGHALMLGLSLQLVDRILTATLDLAWRPGWWAMVSALLLTAPALIVARDGLRAEPGEPRRSPLPLAMPLVLLACSVAVSHPTRLSEPLGLSLPTTFWVMALSIVVGMAVAGLTDQFLKSLAARSRTRPARLRAAYQAWRTTLTVIAVVGLLSGAQWALRAAVVVGPTVVAINLAALLRARPIGRDRLIGGVLPLLSWWLTIALAAQSNDHFWPAAVALALLYGYATVSLLNQERVDPTHERVEHWTLLGHALLLVVAAWPALARVAPPAAHVLAGDRLTVAVVDAAGTPRSVARRLAAVSAARPDLVMLLGDRRGSGLRFDDSAWWLSRSLGLTVRLQSRGDLALLARVAPLETSVVGANAMAGLWPLSGDNGLAAAVLDAPERESTTIEQVLPSLAPWPRRLLAGRVADGTPPPPGYDDLLAGEPCELVLWGAGGVAANVVARPELGVVCVEVVVEP
ncbi:MAG: hypothetical protein HZB16_03345 [Armatimonadetes bacterium]|nr:hypothetical protein [Armatimonadota bacterium]